MKLVTKILENNSKNISKVLELLNSNKVVALPTETVYGLAGNAYSNIAIKKIFDAKNRPSSNPLIIHFKDINSALASIKVDSRIEKLARSFWPGPLTLVAKINNNLLSSFAYSEMETVAVRVPSNKIFLKILNLLDYPLAAPSANRYGKITPTCANDVKEELDGKIEVILDGGTSSIGLESTVLDVSTSATILLRPGGLEKEKIKKMTLVNNNLHTKLFNSPGLSKCHYQPNTPVRINADKLNDDEALLAFGNIPREFKGPKLSLSKKKCLKESAKNLYKMLRILDKKKSKSIAVQKIPQSGLGAAINERLLKASYKEDL